MNRRRMLLVAGALVAAFGPLSSAYAQSALAEIQKRKSIRIAVPADTPPFGSTGVDGQLAGLDVEMAKLIGTKLGAAVTLVPVTSAQRLPMLQEKKVDLVIATLGKNPEREKVIDFTADYSLFYLAIFGPAARTGSSIDELKGLTIAVTRDSLEDQELTKQVGSNLKIERFTDVGEAINAFAAGKAQLLACGVSAVAAAMVKNPKLDAQAKIVLKESKNYIGVSKGEDKLREAVNQVIEEARSSGELRKMASKWFSRTGMR